VLRDNLKSMIYGGIVGMMDDTRLFHKSTVDAKYSEWTPEGIKALHEYMKLMTTQIVIAEEEAISQKAKDMVINGLKGVKI
jgi:hypothetical protein